jgi:murein DD-endopeptidase MepM/ murein hydrolase activator NlpD
MACAFYLASAGGGTKGVLMLRNIRFFVLSGSSLKLREIRFFKAKVLGSTLAISTLVLGALVLLNFLAGDVLGLGFDRMAFLSSENRVLKEQLRDLKEKMASVERSLASVAERGDELRLAADLHRIDPDTREASIGGAKPPMTNAFLSGEADEILTATQSLINKLTREVKLQQASYEEVRKRMEYNRKFFEHMPAIKPMRGAYSINGFGMRIHPVLHVYKPHTGVDIINDVGTDVYATADGEVVFSGHTAAGYGTVVEISHGYGFSTLYAHLSRVLVQRGQAVRRGDLIAKSGRSGLVSGPHLHYEVRRGGAKQNPVDYFFDDIDAARYREYLASAK